MIGRLYVVHRGAEQLLDPECSIRPHVDCARCHAPVATQLLLRDDMGGWSVLVRCHGASEMDEVNWKDLLTGDIVVGPAFDPDRFLVRRAG